jgi:hypothetical protein
MVMNFQCAFLRLAMVTPPTTSATRPAANRLPKAANDNDPVWPLIPFPAGWHASS